MNGMSKWEKRAWLIFAMGLSIGIAVHFGNAALEKLEAIRLIGEKSLVKVENAGRIVEEAKPAVTRAADNSDILVRQSDEALKKVTALEERYDHLEREMRDRADRLEWRIEHPLDAILGRKPKEVRR